MGGTAANTDHFCIGDLFLALARPYLNEHVTRCGFNGWWAHFTMTLAYNHTDVSALEPFNFIRLIIAALIGYFVFSELPDIWTWVGAAIIIASSTYIAHREALLSNNNKNGGPLIAKEWSLTQIN